MFVIMELPCSGEWHHFSVPTVMYALFSADTIRQRDMYVVPTSAMFVNCVNFYL